MKALDVCLPVGALAAALLLFGGFVWLGGASPVETWTILFKGAFGDWFSWQNTLQRAAPLMLTALCVALPARAGLIIIGGEGAVVLGGLAAAALPYAIPLPGNAFLQVVFTDAEASVTASPPSTIGYTNLKGYAPAGNFEGHVTYGLGLQTKANSDQVLLLRLGELTKSDGAGGTYYVVFVDIQTA